MPLQSEGRARSGECLQASKRRQLLVRQLEGCQRLRVLPLRQAQPGGNERWGVGSPSGSIWRNLAAQLGNNVLANARLSLSDKLSMPAYAA